MGKCYRCRRDDRQGLSGQSQLVIGLVIVLVLEFSYCESRTRTITRTRRREATYSSTDSSSTLFAVPLYSLSLLRSVRMLTSRSFAAWVRLPLHCSTAARMCRFSISASGGKEPLLAAGEAVSALA